MGIVDGEGQRGLSMMAPGGGDGEAETETESSTLAGEGERIMRAR